MRRIPRLALALALTTCNVPHADHNAARDAVTFTTQHASHHLHASVGGNDCRVFVITTTTALDQDAVESIQYGTGDYGAFGGADQFAHEHGFRAVVYRDSNGALWTYGATSRDEARSMPHCR